MEWKWSNGTICERSARKIKNTEKDNKHLSVTLPKEIADNTTYLQSLNCDIPNEFKESNKREDSYNRIAEREMISQIGQNPFFRENENYVHHIEIQDQFLKPINTISTDKSQQILKE